MKTACPICSTTITAEFTLKNMPSAAQAFRFSQEEGRAERVDMQIATCAGCGTVQHLGSSVPEYKNVIRSTKFSEEMLTFRKHQFEMLLRSSDKSKTSVFELGAGKGEYLDIFKSLGCTTGGVENSVDHAQLCKKKGHNVLAGFFGDDECLGDSIEKKYDFAVSFNFIEHLPNPRASLAALSRILIDDGVALLEVPNFELIENNKLFNEFIPDHRFYFTRESYRTLLSLAGFELVSLDTIWHDYIISAKVKKRVVYNWRNYENTRLDLMEKINKFFDGTKPTENAIWSAGHQSLATISNLAIERRISCVIDSSIDKQNLFCPASGLPVLSPEYFFAGNYKKVLLLAAGYNEEIKRLIRLNVSGELIVASVDHGKIKYE